RRGRHGAPERPIDRQEALRHQGRPYRRLARHPRAHILAAQCRELRDQVHTARRAALRAGRRPHDLRRAAPMLPRLYRRHHRHPGLNSAIDTIVTAETPEGISIPIRPAGFAVRATAFLVDALIRIALFSVCASLFSMGRKGGVGLFLISAFVINWLSPVLFEMSAAAATPGKRIFGLYVLMANGLPITPTGCLIRNLLRVVDMLPLLYAFAIVSILLRRDSRRLGDLAAGTVVAYRHEVQLTGKLSDGIPIP